MANDNGGIAIVQNPDDAEVPDLPLNAIRRVKVNRILPVTEMAEFLTEEVSKPVRLEEHSMTDTREQRRFDGITCPDCDGPIFECKDGPLVFECIVGHSYAPETMRVEHCKKIENTLWSATAALEEHATVLRRIAEDRHAVRPEHEIKDLEDEARQKGSAGFGVAGFH